MHTLLAITNDHARRADSDAESAALSVLRAKADVVVAQVGSADDLRVALEREPSRDPVVCGGDGSMHAVVAALEELGQLDSRTVGLVPLGTGNDLARTMQIPLDPEQAARTILDGVERRFDLLADDTGRIVVNAVHLGVGAEAAQRAAALKHRLGRFSYAVGAMAAGVTSRGWPLRVTVDDEVLADGRQPVLMVGLSNGATVGGGTPLGPHARPEDGLVDVMVAMSTGPIARLGFARWLARGRHHHRRDVVSMRGRRVHITGEPVPVNADGELIGPASARTWTVRPSALRLMVPE